MREFSIFGEPGAKGRPKFSTRGGFVNTYTDKKTRNYEKLVQSSYLQKFSDLEPYTGELSVVIKSYFSIPKSVSKKKRNMMINGKIHPTKKPDSDNIAKVILDSLNKVAFEDDKQVIFLVVEKHFSEKPRVEVKIEKIIDR